MDYSSKLAASAVLALSILGAGCATDPYVPHSSTISREIVEKETTVVVASPQPEAPKPNPPPPQVNILDSIRDAQLREMMRQNGAWTDDKIRKNPYGFVQDQIRYCDKLKATIENRRISITRLGKQATRIVEESDGTIARYTKFLADAKAAYLQAEKDDKWPVTLNGFELDQEALDDRIADALERIDLATKAKATNAVVAKKVERQTNVLKGKARELASLRRELAQQSEQIRMNEVLSETGDFTEILGRIKDMTIEIDAESVTPSLDDLADVNPNAGRKKTVRDFLDGK